MSDIELDSGAEDAPLLNRDLGSRVDAPIPGYESDQDANTHGTNRIGGAKWQIHSPKQIVILVAVIKFLIVASGMLLVIPLYRLIEDMLCHVYYEDDSSDIIDEMQCKGDEVQARFAYMLGWFTLLSSIISLILAFPYGMLADRIGRKPTVFISYLGLSTSFYFSPLMLRFFNHFFRRHPYGLMFGYVFQIFGGGFPVLLATLYAIASDVSSEQEKATSFLYLTFGATAGGLVGPVLAGILMTKFGPWIPIYCVLTTTPIVFTAIMFIPETLKTKVKNRADEGGESGMEAVKKHMARGLHDLRQSVGMMRNRNIPLILLTFLFQAAQVSAYTTTLTQYISKHFKWKLAETTLLLSPFGLQNLLLLALLPKISDILISRRFKFSVFGKDLLLTRVATLLIVVGAIIDGFSSDIVFFLFGLFVSTFGAADSPLARATISHHVDPQFTSRLQALIGMAEVLGSFAAGPILALLFDTGLKKKGLWKGLPWFYIALLRIVSWIGLAFVQAPEKDAQAATEAGNVADDDDEERLG